MLGLECGTEWSGFISCCTLRFFFLCRIFLVLAVRICVRSHLCCNRLRYLPWIYFLCVHWSLVQVIMHSNNNIMCIIFLWNPLTLWLAIKAGMYACRIQGFIQWGVATVIPGADPGVEEGESTKMSARKVHEQNFWPRPQIDKLHLLICRDWLL